MTIYCQECHTANRDGSLYCNQCGVRLTGLAPGPLICPACGAENASDARLCIRCSAELSAPVGAASSPTLPPEAEEPLESDVLSLDALALALTAPEAARDQGALDSIAVGPAAEDVLERPPSVVASDLVDQLVAGLAPRSVPAAGDLLAAMGPTQFPESLPASPVSSSARTFASVVATEPVMPVSEPSARGPSRFHGVLMPRLLYVVLLAAVLFPFLVPGDWSGSTIPLSPATASFYQMVSQLRPGSAVLVAFDYDPATQGEISTQARPILAHLMQRGARVIALSLLPQGPALAEDILQEMAAGQGYRYGEDYINLGYVAGEEAALAVIGESLTTGLPVDYREHLPTAGRPVLQGIRGVRSLDAVIVLSGDESDVNRWIGQVQGRYGVKLSVGVSGVTLAQMEPFLQSGQLVGVVGGLPGAAEYELLLNQPGRAVQMLDAQSLAHGVIAFFIIVGNLTLLLTSLRSKGRPSTAS